MSQAAILREAEPPASPGNMRLMLSPSAGLRAGMRARMAPGLTQATIVTVPRTAPDLPASSIASRLAVSMPTNSQPWMPAVTSTRGPLADPLMTATGSVSPATSISVKTLMMVSSSYMSVHVGVPFRRPPAPRAPCPRRRRRPPRRRGPRPVRPRCARCRRPFSPCRCRPRRAEGRGHTRC